MVIDIFYFIRRTMSVSAYPEFRVFSEFFIKKQIQDEISHITDQIYDQFAHKVSFHERQNPEDLPYRAFWYYSFQQIKCIQSVYETLVAKICILCHILAIVFVRIRLCGYFFIL